MSNFILSKKYKDFLKYNKAELEILEGTTAAGKTTVGIVKFLLKVAESKKKIHVISAQNLGIAEKNIINKDLGITDIFGQIAEYNNKGKGNETLSHIIYHTPNGDKIIYVIGYDNASRWKSILGGQYGCVYIDEINIADMAYVRQIAMRCDYLMGTLNPDDPDREIYKEFINRCRPIEKYKDDAPAELLKMLDEPEHKNWVWWYFDFEDNAGLTKEKINQIKETHVPGSADYKHYILGLRGKAEGVIFDNFSTKTHLITEEDAHNLIKENAIKRKEKEWFIQFLGGMDTAYSSNSEDTVAMCFLGITNKQRLFYLDEEVLNNKDNKLPFAPSDIAQKYQDFLEKNRNKYGFARDVFIDSADQATITELKKYKMRTGSIYNFLSAHKSLKIIDRINLQKGWIATGSYHVVNTCKHHIKELQTYAWSAKQNNVPEDGNDHTINAQQYAWIPYKHLIK